jgi:hypothetical protein
MGCRRAGCRDCGSADIDAATDGKCIFERSFGRIFAGTNGRARTSGF